MKRSEPLFWDVSGEGMLAERVVDGFARPWGTAMGESWS